MEDRVYRIIMVDDDSEDVFAVRKGLSAANFKVDFTEMTSAMALYDYLGQPDTEMPDLILLDINMPRINGFEVLERLKSEPRWRDIATMILSTSSTDMDRAKSIQMGASAFVTKFSSVKSLADWVQSVETFLKVDTKKPLL